MNSLDIFGPGVENVWAKQSRRRGRVAGSGPGPNRSVPSEVKSQLGQAELLFVNGEGEKAAEILSVVSQRYPHLPDPYNIMALIYEESGDIDKALKLYTLTASLLPRKHADASLWAKIADLAESCGNYGHAIMAINSCLKLEATPDHFIAKLGILVRQQSPHATKETLKQFLQKFPEEIGYLVEFGDILLDAQFRQLGIYVSTNIESHH